MKKLLVLLLAAAMIMSLAACGSSAGSASASSAASSTAAAEEAEETAADTAAPAAEAAAAAEAVSAAEEVSADEEAAQEPANSVEYPLTDEEITLSYWNLYMTNMTGWLDDWNDHVLNDFMAERTGVRIEWHDVTVASASENFNLIVASGDYYDFMNVGKYYTGGLAKALEDGVIIDMTDYVDEWAPDFLAAMNVGDTKRDLTDDDGRILQFYTIQDEFLPVSGLTLRQDWLDELGLDVPQTTDELYDTMVAVKNAHPECKRVLYLDNEGKMNEIYGAFDTMALSMTISMMSTEGTNIAGYQRDGTVCSGLRDDGFREYLEYFHKIYDAGLTDPDFYNAADSGESQNANRSAGDQFIWYGNSDDFSTIEDNCEDENCDVEAIPAIVKNEGDTYKYGEYHSYLGMQAASVCSSCEYPEIAVAYLNYFYTDQGAIDANYGEEGVSLAYDENGDPQYTDTVLANPEGMATNVAMMYYSWSNVPTLNFRERSFSAYLDKEIEAMDLWKESSTGENILPTLNFTTEESSEYASLSSDMYTYACETVLKFVTGALEINDDNWNAFQNELTAFGLDRCVEIYQAALDRYYAR